MLRAGDPLYLGLFGWALARAYRIPLVIRINADNDKARETMGNPIFPRLFRTAKREKSVERFVFRRADLVAAPNQENLDFAIENGANPAAATIFRYGNLIAPEHLEEPSSRPVSAALLQKLGVKRGEFALCIGRLEPVKLLQDLVRVLQMVRDRRRLRDWQFELIETGKTGELAPPRDVKAMGESVIRLLDNQAYRMTMGRNLRQRAFEMLDPERLNAHWRDEYRKLLAKTDA